MHAENTYTAEQIRQIQAELKTAEARNRKVLIAGAIGTAAVLLIGGAAILSVDPAYALAVAVVFVVVFVIAVFVGGRFFPGLKCPGCSHELVGSFGAFCPVCGGYGLEIIGSRIVKCRNCSRTLRYGKHSNRNFKAKHCTGCAVPLGLKRNGI